KKLNRTNRKLTQRLGREPLAAELGAELGLPIERVIELQRLIADPISLETPVGDGESSFTDVLEDTRVPQPHEDMSGRMRERELRDLEARNPSLKDYLPGQD